jgi:hypothetical protein
MINIFLVVILIFYISLFWKNINNNLKKLLISKSEYLSFISIRLTNLFSRDYF